MKTAPLLPPNSLGCSRNPSARDIMPVGVHLNGDLLPDVLKLPPISQHGNVAEIARLFGGFDQLGNAVNQLQSLLYAA